jgi:hypothetical protein
LKGLDKEEDTSYWGKVVFINTAAATAMVSSPFLEDMGKKEGSFAITLISTR